MISELLKGVMRACNLKQTDLAEVLGTSLSRVKAITSGRVKNLTREENEALISKLGIRAGWLITGEGDMFGIDETQEQFIARQRAAKRMRDVVEAMPIDEKIRTGLALCMSGDPLKDGPLIFQLLASVAPPTPTPSPGPVLTADEAALLADYRASHPVVRRSIKAALRAAMPDSGGEVTAPRRRTRG